MSNFGPLISFCAILVSLFKKIQTTYFKVLKNSKNSLYVVNDIHNKPAKYQCEILCILGYMWQKCGFKYSE
jgi:hypothetical protein